MFVMPAFYQNRLSTEKAILTQGTLLSISKNIATYLDDLDRLTLTPYTNNKLIDALKYFVDKNYDKNSYSAHLAQIDIMSSIQVSLSNIRRDIRSILIVGINGQTNFFDRYWASGIIPDYNFKVQEWYKKAVLAGIPF